MAKTKEKGQRTSNYRYLQTTTQKTEDSEIFQERVDDIKREIRSVDRRRTDNTITKRRKNMKRQTTLKKETND